MKNLNKIRSVLLSLIITSLQVSALFSQVISLGPYTSLPKSRLWLEGKSNINKFSCESESLKSYAYFGPESFLLPVNNFDDVQSNTSVYFFIPVQSFDCGKKKMNKDMYKALNEKQNPTIKYELIKSQLIASPDTSSEWFQVNTHGNLTIAGMRKEIEMVIKIRPLSNGKYQVIGAIPISMYDFNIKPPSAFFGLIKAKPELFVRFDIKAMANQIDGTANQSNISINELRNSNQILTQRSLNSTNFDCNGNNKLITIIPK